MMLQPPRENAAVLPLRQLISMESKMKYLKGVILVAGASLVYSAAAGAVVSSRFTADLAPAVNAVDDVIEVHVIPAGEVLVDVIVDVASDLGATVDIGVLDGEYGEVNSEREIVHPIFKGLTLTKGVHRITLPEAMIIPRYETAKGIGVVIKDATGLAAGTVGITLQSAG